MVQNGGSLNLCQRRLNYIEENQYKEVFMTNYQQKTKLLYTFILVITIAFLGEYLRIYIISSKRAKQKDCRNKNTDTKEKTDRSIVNEGLQYNDTGKKEQLKN